jgi:hypothetical protein
MRWRDFRGCGCVPQIAGLRSPDAARVVSRIEGRTVTNDGDLPSPVAEQLAALYDEVETSGPIAITVNDLLKRLGEPEPTLEARIRATLMLAKGGLTPSALLSAAGLWPTSRVKLRLTAAVVEKQSNRFRDWGQGE